MAKDEPSATDEVLPDPEENLTIDEVIGKRSCLFML